jgi:hypothetical protein
VAALQGTDTAIYGALGVSFWPRRLSADRWLAVGIRLDALVLNHSVNDERMQAMTPKQSKWMPGVDALAELAFSVSPALDIVTSLGIEAALGTTDVLIETTPASLIPVLRGVGEVGIRISF